MLTRIVLILSLFAGSAAAQGLAFDFDSDGQAETLRLIKGSGDWQHLLIESEGMGVIFAPKIAAKDNMAQNTQLLMSPHGSPQVEIAHLGIGRHKWMMYLTLAYRKDAIRVAGLTYIHYDTLDPDADGTCDVNLLSGKGILTTHAGGVIRETPFDIATPAPALRDWDGEVDMWSEDFLPPLCSD